MELTAVLTPAEEGGYVAAMVNRFVRDAGLTSQQFRELL